MSTSFDLIKRSGVSRVPLPSLPLRPKRIAALVAHPAIAHGFAWQNRACGRSPTRDRLGFQTRAATETRELTTTSTTHTGHALAISDTIHYLFNVPEYVSDFGQELKVVGSLPGLGDWNAHAAPSMKWCEGHRWRLDITLPKQAFEFKVVMMHGNHVRWEQGINRVIQADADSHTQLRGHSSEPLEIIIKVNCQFNHPDSTQLAVMVPLDRMREAFEVAQAALEMLELRKKKLQRDMEKTQTAASRTQEMNAMTEALAGQASSVSMMSELLEQSSQDPEGCVSLPIARIHIPVGASLGTLPKLTAASFLPPEEATAILRSLPPAAESLAALPTSAFPSAAAAAEAEGPAMSVDAAVSGDSPGASSAFAARSPPSAVPHPAPDTPEAQARQQSQAKAAQDLDTVCQRLQDFFRRHPTPSGPSLTRNGDSAAADGQLEGAAQDEVRELAALMSEAEDAWAVARSLSSFEEDEEDEDEVVYRFEHPGCLQEELGEAAAIQSFARDQLALRLASSAGTKAGAGSPSLSPASPSSDGSSSSGSEEPGVEASATSSQQLQLGQPAASAVGPFEQGAAQPPTLGHAPVAVEPEGRQEVRVAGEGSREAKDEIHEEQQDVQAVASAGHAPAGVASEAEPEQQAAGSVEPDQQQQERVAAGVEESEHPAPAVEAAKAEGARVPAIVAAGAAEELPEVSGSEMDELSAELESWPAPVAQGVVEQAAGERVVAHRHEAGASFLADEPAPAAAAAEVEGAGSAADEVAVGAMAEEPGEAEQAPVEAVQQGGDGAGAGPQAEGEQDVAGVEAEQQEDVAGFEAAKQAAAEMEAEKQAVEAAQRGVAEREAKEHAAPAAQTEQQAIGAPEAEQQAVGAAEAVQERGAAEEEEQRGVAAGGVEQPSASSEEAEQAGIEQAAALEAEKQAAAAKEQAAAATQAAQQAAAAVDAAQQTVAAGDVEQQSVADAEVEQQVTAALEEKQQVVDSIKAAEGAVAAVDETAAADAEAEHHVVVALQAKQQVVEATKAAEGAVAAVEEVDKASTAAPGGIQRDQQSAQPAAPEATQQQQQQQDPELILLLSQTPDVAPEQHGEPEHVPGGFSGSSSAPTAPQPTASDSLRDEASSVQRSAPGLGVSVVTRDAPPGQRVEAMQQAAGVRESRDSPAPQARAAAEAPEAQPQAEEQEEEQQQQQQAGKPQQARRKRGNVFERFWDFFKP